MKTFSLPSLLVAAMLTVATLSCNKKKDDPAPAGNNNNNPTGKNPEFLKEGAVSTYISTAYFGTDTIVTKVEKAIAKDTFLVRNYSSADYYLPTQYYALSNGVLSMSSRLRDKASYKVVCKFNQPVGTTWQSTVYGTTYTYSIDALNVSVVTGTGTVTDAVKVRATAGGSSTYGYYSPTAGFVGNGDYGTSSSATMQLKSFTPGTDATAPDKVPAITFGNFPFLKVGNYWKYAEQTFGDNDDTLLVQVQSKINAANIYKVGIYTQSSNSTTYEYWYEDNGLLMVYESGENVNQADPVYMDASQAKVGYGWSGTTSTGSTFIYKIKDLSSQQYTYFGDLNCMEVSVSNGLFSTQSNYWNQDKGNVLVSGFLNMDIIASNAKTAAYKIPAIAGYTY